MTLTSKGAMSRAISTPLAVLSVCRLRSAVLCPVDIGVQTGVYPIRGSLYYCFPPNRSQTIGLRRRKVVRHRRKPPIKAEIAHCIDVCSPQRRVLVEIYIPKRLARESARNHIGDIGGTGTRSAWPPVIAISIRSLGVIAAVALESFLKLPIVYLFAVVGGNPFDGVRDRAVVLCYNRNRSGWKSQILRVIRGERYA